MPSVSMPADYGSRQPAFMGGDHSHPTLPAQFNGFGARMEPPHHAYMAQPPHPASSPPHAWGPGGYQHPFESNITSQDPVVSTTGLKKPEPEEPPVTDPQLEKMNDQQLGQEGNKRLESAKEAYTKYGQINIAQQAKQALQQFIDICTTTSGNTSELVSALKGISLPPGAPTDLAVTIKYPGQPPFSLIPPDEKHLGTANVEDIAKWYKMADQAMGRWSDTNAKDANALASAKQDLDSAVAALKAASETIDRRTKEKTNQPGGSQLEVQYQEHVDRGVTIHFEAKEELLDYTFGGNPANPAGQLPAPADYPDGSRPGNEFRQPDGQQPMPLQNPTQEDITPMPFPRNGLPLHEPVIPQQNLPSQYPNLPAGFPAQQGRSNSTLAESMPAWTTPLGNQPQAPSAIPVYDHPDMPAKTTSEPVLPGGQHDVADDPDSSDPLNGDPIERQRHSVSSPEPKRPGADKTPNDDDDDDIIKLDTDLMLTPTQHERLRESDNKNPQKEKFPGVIIEDLGSED